MENVGLKFSETYGEEKEEGRQRFLAEIIQRFERIGVRLGDVSYISDPHLGQGS